MCERNPYSNKETCGITFWLRICLYECPACLSDTVLISDKIFVSIFSPFLGNLLLSFLLEFTAKRKQK